MNKRRLIFCLCALMMVVIACLAPELVECWRLAAIRQTESLRLAAIRQNISLTDSTSMRIQDACLYPADATHELLRIYVTYEGVDPNRDYNMRAEIARSPHDTTFNHIWHWQVPLPGSGMDKIWEFQNFPRDGHPIFIRIYLRPKTGGEEFVRIFEIPERLRYTPNGEQPRMETKKITETGGPNHGASAQREGRL